MGHQGSGERWLRYVFGTLLFVGVVLYCLHFIPGYPHTHWTELLDHLAGAFIVAAVLGFTVDEYLKRQLIRDVGAIFIGWALPQEVRQRIRKVSETAVVIQDYDAKVKLTIEGEEVILDLEIAWNVFNYSTGKHRYQSACAHDLHEKPVNEATRCELVCKGQTTTWDATKFAHKKLIEQKGDVIIWKIPAIKLPPQDATDSNLKPACRVRWFSRLRLPKYYSTVLSFGSATLRATVTVDCPSELVFSCDHPDSTDTSTNQRSWYHDRLFMQGEVLRIRWKPAKPKSSSS